MVCDIKGVLTAVGGTVLWRSGNLGSVRPPERLGFSAGITQTCGPALKNTLAPASRNLNLPRLVKVSQNISASQCYTRREPDSERDAFKMGLESTAGFPPRSKNKMSGVCEHRHPRLPPPSFTAPPALQLMCCLQEPQQKGNSTKFKPKVVCGEVFFRDKSFQPLQRVKHVRSDSFDLVWILRAVDEPKRLQHCGFPWQGVSAQKSDVTLMSELECDTLIWQSNDYIHVDLGLHHLLRRPEDQSHHIISLQMWPEGQDSNTFEDMLAGMPRQQPGCPRDRTEMEGVQPPTTQVTGCSWGHSFLVMSLRLWSMEKTIPVAPGLEHQEGSALGTTGRRDKRRGIL